MDTILTLVNKGNDFLWSFLLLILLCGTGIYYTIRLKFIQVRKFGEGCKHVFGHFSLNGEKHEKGEMSPFQSIMTAIAAQVGTGNLAGAATALFGGGPGAIFWMWLSAFFGMATIYSEASDPRHISQIVKHLNQRGRHDRKRQPGQCRGDCFIQQIYMMRFHYFAERYSSMPLAPARPASIARITVAAPVTASPPA